MIWNYPGTSTSSASVITASTLVDAVQELGKTRKLELSSDELSPRPENYPLCEGQSCKGVNTYMIGAAIRCKMQKKNIITNPLARGDSEVYDGGQYGDNSNGHRVPANHDKIPRIDSRGNWQDNRIQHGDFVRASFFHGVEICSENYNVCHCYWQASIIGCLCRSRKSRRTSSCI